MLVGAQLVALLARDETLGAAVRGASARFHDALTLDWAAWKDAPLWAPAAFTAGRGYSYGSAREIALKLTETLRIPALGFSSAELRHGPRAAVTPATPVLVLRQNDQTVSATDGLVLDLAEAGETVFTA